MFFWAEEAYGVVPPDQVGSIPYYAFRIFEQMAVFSIPAFLFVSGFFIAFATGRRHETIPWPVVWVRIRDLLIPYTIWSVILWILLFAEGWAFGNHRISLAGLPANYLIGKTNPAYYYVPLLIQFYLLSPLIVRWAKTHPKSLLAAAALIQFAVQLQYYPLLLGVDVSWSDMVPKWLFVTRIFWFSLGVVVGFNIKPMQTVIDRYKVVFLLTAVILFPLGIMEWELMQNWSGVLFLQHRETILDSVYSLAIIFAFVGYRQVKIPLTSQIDDLGSKSFGIYLIHAPVLIYTSRVIFIVVPGLLAYQLIFLASMCVAGLVVPLALMALVNRSPARHYYKYIFG